MRVAQSGIHRCFWNSVIARPSDWGQRRADAPYIHEAGEESPNDCMSLSATRAAVAPPAATVAQLPANAWRAA